MLVRIDDFPTGVRERYRNDLNDFHRVLYEFEYREIPYVLGVVAGLVTDRDLEFLAQLDMCTVAIHGYDHNYPVWNRRNFPEFTGKTEEYITEKLFTCNRILKEHETSMYIPPFNQINQETLDALDNVGFESITSGVDGYGGMDTHSIEVLTPKKEYYGRSTALLSSIGRFNADRDHLSLHLTWEVDEMKSTHQWALPPLLNALKEKMKESNEYSPLSR
jgi:predicted deacetylase